MRGVSKHSISEVFEFVRNGASVKQEDAKGGVPITRIETIWNSTIDKTRFGYADISEKMLGKYIKYLLQDGDILMTHINSVKHLGKSAMYRGTPKKLIHGMNLLNLRPNRKFLFPGYVYYYFNSDCFKTQLPKITNKSVNQASFSAGNFKKLKIPLPSLSVQQKIATILDTADTLKQKDKALIAKYDELSQSLFLDMFGDPVTNPKGWGAIDFLDVFDIKTGKLNSNAEVKDGEYPFFTCSKDILNIDSYSYDCEALLLAGNNAAGVYDVKYYNGKFDAYQRTYILQIKNPQLTYSFMQILLEKKLVDLQRFSLGSNTKYITLKILERINFTAPPITLQNQFAERIQAIEKQKQQAKASLQKSADLFNCLLQKAFKGELVCCEELR